MTLMSKLVFGVLFAFVFSPIAMAAQGTGQAGVVTTVAVLSRMPVGCPVSLRAQHLADGSLLQAGNSHPRGIGQRLHLTLADHRSSQIVTAKVTIHGMSNKGRITQAAASDGSSDAVSTLNVQFSAASPGSVAGDVRVPGMTAVERIDLDSVAYADGSVWSFAGQQACHVTPDPLMLIAGR